MTCFPSLDNCTIAVIGLGYVGLPLAVEFARDQGASANGVDKKRRVIGFDINKGRIDELKNGIEKTQELTKDELKKAIYLELTSDEADISKADIFIVTVPTPIDKTKRPYLEPLKEASITVGKSLRVRYKKSQDLINKTTPIVIFESTVYPGATEEICVPIIQEESGLDFNKFDNGKGFACGYSPERINPGDSKHRLTSIVKVTSGSTKETAIWVDNLYASIVSAGTHMAPSIKVAEAAKVIENTQRDLNIALVNELAIIFNHLNIDTLDVLEAASTKWNFLPFKPGLVGGHCIGVDPYYLTHKAEQHGYHPEVVLAGRRINDGMGKWVVEQLVLSMAQKTLIIGGAKVLVLGLTFKENCPDLRNTRVIDLISTLNLYGIKTTVVDKWVDPLEAKNKYGIEVIPSIPKDIKFSAVIAAVAHKEFCSLSSSEWKKLIIQKGVLVDLKGIMQRELDALRL